MRAMVLREPGTPLRPERVPVPIPDGHPDPLGEANDARAALRSGEIAGAVVLRVGTDEAP